MRRILIIGSPGAGKSTLARTMGTLLGLEVVHMDRLYWKPGWVAVTRTELEEKLADVMRRESWIIDGNYLSTMDMRLREADTVIFLDYPLPTCLYGVLKRRIVCARTPREDITAGCTERLDMDFLAFVLQFPFRQRPLVCEKLSARGDLDLLVFRNRRALNAFVRDLAARSR